MLPNGPISAGALIEIVSDFHAANMDPRLWPTALAKVGEAIRADACAIAYHDFDTGDGALLHSVGLDAEAIETYARVCGTDNAWLRREEYFLIPGTVRTGDELVPEDAASQDGFAETWLTAHGLKHQLFGTLERQGRCVRFVYALRGVSESAFSAGDASLLARLMPHLQNGLQAGTTLRRAQNLCEAAFHALNAMPIGVVLVGSGGAVITANRVARDIMADRYGIRIGRGGLEVLHEGKRRLLTDMIKGHLEAPGRSWSLPTMEFPIAQLPGARPISMVVHLISDRRRGSGRDVAAAVFLGDPEHVAEVSEDRLRALYGLTRTEARVAALLARGYRLEQISERLGSARETTRKHLREIFAKTRVTRQADCVRMIMTGPAGLVI